MHYLYYLISVSQKPPNLGIISTSVSHMRKLRRQEMISFFPEYQWPLSDEQWLD